MGTQSTLRPKYFRCANPTVESRCLSERITIQKNGAHIMGRGGNCTLIQLAIKLHRNAKVNMFSSENLPDLTI